MVTLNHVQICSCKEPSLMLNNRTANGSPVSSIERRAAGYIPVFARRRPVHGMAAVSWSLLLVSLLALPSLHAEDGGQCPGETLADLASSYLR